MTHKKKLIVTIPAYNEQQSIGRVVQDVSKVLQSRDVSSRYDTGILVVDDGSADGTAKAARTAGAQAYSHRINYGLAETFRTEMQKCLEMGADIIVHIDADGQYRASDIPKLLAKTEEGYDLVLGSRFLGTIEHMPLVKRMGNIAFSRLISNVTGLKITDGQTGFRAFTSRLARVLSLTSNHTYTQEQIIRAVKEKFSVAEVPVYFARRSDGQSRLIRNPFEYAVRAMFNMLRILRDYQPMKFFGLFSAFFLTIGLVLSLWIMITLAQTGTVGALPRVMVAVLFLSVGVQIFLFGFLADMMKR